MRSWVKLTNSWPDRSGSIADFDAIRHEIGDALGNNGPRQWLTIVFTADPDLV